MFMKYCWSALYYQSLEVTKQQVCMKQCSSVSVAGLMLKCWLMYKLVVYFQQGHCPTSYKSVACPRRDSMSPCFVLLWRFTAFTWKHSQMHRDAPFTRWAGVTISYTIWLCTYTWNLIAQLIHCGLYMSPDSDILLTSRHKGQCIEAGVHELLKAVKERRTSYACTSGSSMHSRVPNFTLYGKRPWRNAVWNQGR